MSIATQTAPEAPNPLGVEREGKLLVNFAIPCIISMLVTALYNIVDQIFIGRRAAGQRGDEYRLPAVHGLHGHCPAAGHRQRNKFFTASGRRA